MFVFIFSIGFLSNATSVYAGWVSGYYKSNGTYVNGYYKTEPNYYKWDNLSWNGDWSDSLNDKSWYRDFGYDPEPWDNEIPSYDYWNNYNTLNSWDSYDSWDYDYGWDSYDSWDYDYGWDW